MKFRFVSVLLAVAALLLSHTGIAQEQARLGAAFYNGLPDNIIEGAAARAEKCDVYICGEFVKRSVNLFPIPPHTSAVVVNFGSPEENKDPVCVFDLRILTQSLSGDTLEEHIFKGINFCTPAPSVISFERAATGVFAVQGYEDAQGVIQATIILSEQMSAQPILAAATEEPAYKGVVFYNGLPETIVEGYAARADNCDAYICGKWQQSDSNIVPLKSHAAAAVFRLPSAEREKTCRWDIKIVTQSASGSKAEYIFRGLEICTPEPSIVAFQRDNFGVFAFQAYTNNQGTASWARLPAE